jgi:Flp pilus assembly protein TadD
MTQLTLQDALRMAWERQQSGQFADAESIYRQILAVDPAQPQAVYGMGIVAARQGKPDALDWLKRAGELAPGVFEVQYNLGLCLYSRGRIDEALRHYQRSLELKADSPEAHNSIGIALSDRGQFDGALAAYERAIQLRPSYPEAHYNRGNLLQVAGRFEDAEAEYRAALAARPNYALAHNNLASVLRSQGRFNDAVASARQAIAFRPDLADAHLNLGMMLLMLGQFEEGAREYEWRWRTDEYRRFARALPGPLWDGSPPRDPARSTLLLHSEQGFGDTIQFVRHIRFCIEQGWRVLLQCPPELLRLLQQNDGLGATVLPGDPTGRPPAEAFHAHLPLASVPLVLHQLDPTGATGPYLHAQAADRAIWRQRLEAAGPGPRIGLVWAGSSAHKNDRNRSIRLADLAPLGRVPARFFSLQIGPATDQLRQPPPGLSIIDLSESIHDFADTAAALAELDLLISVDTALVHLAGALGRPAWVLLPFVPDFRWLLGRSDSPLYPSLRLFRQDRPGDWHNAIGRLTDELLGAFPAKST